MNPGCSYLLDILYVGALFPSTELSTSLHKCAPAAPKCTDLKSVIHLLILRVSWLQLSTYSPIKCEKAQISS